MKRTKAGHKGHKDLVQRVQRLKGTKTRPKGWVQRVETLDMMDAKGTKAGCEGHRAVCEGHKGWA